MPQYHVRCCECHRCNRPKPYGPLRFLFDLIMCAITGGLWLIWIFVREMRKN